MKKVQSQLHTRRGFTLFEVIVSLAIFTLLTTTVLLRHSRFKGDILITNLATQVALTIREAQVSSLSVRAQAGTFNTGYGVLFTKANPTQYILFSDNGTTPGVYDSGDVIIETVKLPPGNTISKFCGFDGSLAPGFEPVASCSGTTTPVSKLNITFIRPNPDARVVRQDTANISTPINPPYTFNARIYVRSPNGLEKKVRVSALGLVSVEQ